MSKQAFLLEIEVPEGARWITPPEQVAKTIQSTVIAQLKTFAFPGRGDVAKVTMRPFDWRYPDPRLEGTHACILYFETKEDLIEFEEQMKIAKPNMTTEHL